MDDKIFKRVQEAITKHGEKTENFPKISDCYEDDESIIDGISLMNDILDKLGEVSYIKDFYKKRNNRFVTSFDIKLGVNDVKDVKINFALDFSDNIKLEADLDFPIATIEFNGLTITTQNLPDDHEINDKATLLYGKLWGYFYGPILKPIKEVIYEKHSS